MFFNKPVTHILKNIWVLKICLNFTVIQYFNELQITNLDRLELFLLINIIFLTVFVVNEINLFLNFSFIFALALQLGCDVHIQRFKLFEEDEHCLNLFKHNVECISFFDLSWLSFEVNLYFMIFDIRVGNEDILIKQSSGEKYIV